MGIGDWLHQLLTLTSGVLALVLTVTALAPLVQSGGDAVCFSAQSILVVTALLGAVTGGLGIMFKAYQGAVNDRLADLLGQCAGKDKEIDYWRASSERNIGMAETATRTLRSERSRPETRG